ETRTGAAVVLRAGDDLPRGDPDPIVDVAPSALAVMCDTAGTAGGPKAAMLTHGNLSAALGQMAADRRTAVGPTDVWPGLLPLFHIGGLNVVLGATLAGGGQVRLVDGFEPSAALDEVTVVAGVPSMFDAWAAAGTRMPDARIVVSGAAPLTHETAERFRAATAITL